MLVPLTCFFITTISAVPFPPPTGPYNVGIKQHIFNHTTPNDPVAPANASSILLATIYYPTLSIPVPGNNTAPYLDLTTAELWGSILQFPNNSLQDLTTWNQLGAPPLDKNAYGVSQKPTIIFSPGGGENAIMYNQLNADLASQGYTVLALDHPGETPYLQLPDGKPGIYGIDITAVWPASLQRAVYEMRASDTLATITTLYPTYVSSGLWGAGSAAANWNMTHFLTIGHSIGGSASALAASKHVSILAAINLDGLFFAPYPDVRVPVLMLAGEEHTPAIDPSWSPFSQAQTGTWEWWNVTGASHQNFADLGDWVDIQGLRGKTGMPSLGPIWSSRMDAVVRGLVEGWFGWVIGEGARPRVPDVYFPEVVRVNGSEGVV